MFSSISSQGEPAPERALVELPEWLRPRAAEERRDAERDRRIAGTREERAGRPTAQALAAKAAATGNGGPPMLAPPTEMRAIGEALYGRRWMTELAEDLARIPGSCAGGWPARRPCTPSRLPRRAGQPGAGAACSFPSSAGTTPRGRARARAG